MSAKKFEQLINLIINEDKERAEQLFHEIVVEKSREIYESIIDEDQAMGLLDEIESEDQGMDGMMEADEEFETDEEIDGDYDVDGEEGDFSDEEEDEFDMDDMEDADGEDMDDEDMDGMDDEEEIEDRVVDLEDKLDQLMADFEAQMGGDGDDEEMSDEEVMESMELKKVSVTHGDNGVQTKSPGLANPKRVQTGGAPVKFADGGESEPRSTPKVSNAYTKGEGKLSASAKNVDGAYAFKEKGEAAPKPKTETVSAKSPVAESRKTVKRRI